MQQLTFLEAGKVEWRDVPEPTLENDGQAIVRPLTVATCDLDAALMFGQAPYKGPFGLGHEGVAEVVDVGDDAGGLQPDLLRRLRAVPRGAHPVVRGDPADGHVRLDDRR